MRARLTAKRIESVEPSSKRTKLHDTEVPGLELRIYPSGKRTWSYIGRQAGRVRHQQLGVACIRDFRLHDLRHLLPMELVVASANRDERRHEYPDVFDIHRDDLQHLTFGRGVHFCLGASVARLEARVALEEVLKRGPRVVVPKQAYDIGSREPAGRDSHDVESSLGYRHASYVAGESTIDFGVACVVQVGVRATLRSRRAGQ